MIYYNAIQINIFLHPNRNIIVSKVEDKGNFMEYSKICKLMVLLNSEALYNQP